MVPVPSSASHPRRREPVVPSGAVTDVIVGPVPPEDFTPRLLVLVAGVLLKRESQLFRERFRLAANDWRVLSFVAVQPGVTATELAELIDVDKALVSRSVNTLAERRAIVLSDGPRGTRPLYLTESGVRLRAEMEPLAMEAYEIVQSVLTEQEIETSNRVLRTLLAEVRART